jgi:hypothetical protein
VKESRFDAATVAVANKLARIVWAVWVQQRPFAAFPQGPWTRKERAPTGLTGIILFGKVDRS